MPIYEYRCDSCGFQKEYLLRMSDAPLTVCPQCNKPTFSKMVTAAGFQLKGGGWYVTDFKSGGSNTSGAGKKSDDKQKDATSQSDSAQADKPKAETASSTTPAAAPSTPSTPAPSTSSSGS
jgi:putative FmdB family regulatory protein